MTLHILRKKGTSLTYERTSLKMTQIISYFGEGNGNPLQYSCLENHRDSMKRQKDVMLEGEPPRSGGVQLLLGKSRGHYQYLQ